VTPEQLLAIRHAVCAIGWIGTTMEEFNADPKRGKFEIEGTGFLIDPRHVVTCEHVVSALQEVGKKQGPRPFVRVAQFVYPPVAGAFDMVTAFRSFEVAQADPKIDIAILTLDGTPVAPLPLRVVPGDYTPVVGEPVGLCGYAHGSVLLKRGKETYRLGPVVQVGIVAALSPFDLARPDAAILDIVTGPAASGSPIFRQATGEVLGLLLEGQIKQRAALSIARLVFMDTDGALAAHVRNFDTKLIRTVVT